RDAAESSQEPAADRGVEAASGVADANCRAADCARHSLSQVLLMTSDATSPPVSTNPPSGAAAVLPRSPFDFAAWLIDLDRTLYRQPPVRCVMALQVALFGRSAVPIIREFRREHERMHHEPAPANSDPFEIQIERTAKRLGVESGHVRELVDEWMFVRPARWL